MDGCGDKPRREARRCNTETHTHTINRNRIGWKEKPNSPLPPEVLWVLASSGGLESFA